MIDDIGRPGRPMADYMRTIRKGWWIVAATVLIVAAATYFVSSQQQPKFQATADDLIVAPTFDPTQKLSSSALTQYVNTQASIAQSPQVAAAALALAPQIKDLTPGKLLKSSTITSMKRCAGCWRESRMARSPRSGSRITKRDESDF